MWFSDHGGRVPLILASVSPRRQTLMREYGYEVQVIAPPFEEPDHLGGQLPPEQLAEALSYYKAAGVAGLIEFGVVLSGDTIVSLDGCVFGKPVDRDDARTILQNLSGTTHRVITGVSLVDAKTHHRLIEYDSTAVSMRALTQEELEHYLDTGSWRGKAGAYGIQDRSDPFVQRIEGSFTNVVGLPMGLVGRMLARWGFWGAASESASGPLPQ